ncbi:AbfB domain-containing protein [Streptomyces stelliscabiei]
MRLDSVGSYSGGETREDSSFKVVSGLAKSSCYSFKMADGRYVRHQSFRLRVSGNDGSELFRQDATFCPMQSPYSDAVMLQAVNYPTASCATRTSSWSWTRTATTPPDGRTSSSAW